MCTVKPWLLFPCLWLFIDWCWRGPNTSQISFRQVRLFFFIADMVSKWTCTYWCSVTLPHKLCNHVPRNLSSSSEPKLALIMFARTAPLKTISWQEGWQPIMWLAVSVYLSEHQAGQQAHIPPSSPFLL